MKKILLILMVSLVFLSTFSIFAPQVKTTDLGVWITNPAPLPNPTAGHSSIVHDGSVYVIGGLTTGAVRVPNVYFGHIDPNGAVGSWIATTPLPEWRQAQPAVAWNNFVYVIGGEGPEWGGRSEQNTVYYAEIGYDGTIEVWNATTPLPDRLQHHAAMVWNGRIYVIGGWNGYHRKNTIYIADINTTDGSIGGWRVNPTSLPRGYEQMGVVVHDDVKRVYLTGGWRPPLDIVYSAPINEVDGNIGPVRSEPQLPKALASVRTVLIGDDIYVVGGRIGLGDEIAEKMVYKATIEEDGTLGDWTELQSIPEGRAEHSLVTLHGRIYVIGGAHEWPVPEDTIYYSTKPPITATVDVKPDTLNLKSNGEWITVYIELPEGYNVSDIDASSILLNDTIPVDLSAPTSVGDYDGDGIPDLVVKFDRAEVISYVQNNVNMTQLIEERSMTITLTITSGLNDETSFEGSDTIRVMMPGAKGPGKHTLRK